MTRPGPSTLLGAAFVVALVGHAAIVAAPHAQALLRDAPATWADHGRQLIAARAEARTLEATGRRWGYDPSVHAGAPCAATVTDSHLQPLAFVALRGLGDARAYSLWVVTMALAVPLLLAAAAWVAAGTAEAAWWAGIAGAGLLLLDPLVRLMERQGMNNWLLGSAVVVLFAATFGALLDAPTRGRWAAALATLPLLAAHVLCPVTVAALFVLLLGLRLARLDGRRAALGRAAVVALAGLVLNAWWVLPFVRHMWFFELDVWGEAFTATPRKALLDLLSAVWPGVGYLGSTLGLRWAALVLGLWAGLRRGAPLPLRAVAAACALLLVVGYVGSLLPRVANLEPHRFATMAILAAAALLGPGLHAARDAWRAVPRARPALVALGASAALSLACEGRAAWSEPARPRALDPDEEQVVTALRGLPADRGRLLTEVMLRRGYLTNSLHLALPDHAHISISSWFFGTYGRTTWLGAPPQLLCKDPREVVPAEVPGLLSRYAVAFVLTRSRYGFDLLDGAPAGTFASVSSLGAWRLYEVARPAGWFLEGTGRLTFSPGRLALTDLTGPVVLRWHHLPRLRAEESDEVVVSPFPVEGDPVPFIRVDPRGRRAVTLVWDG